MSCNLCPSRALQPNEMTIFEMTTSRGPEINLGPVKVSAAWDPLTIFIRETVPRRVVAKIQG